MHAVWNLLVKASDDQLVAAWTVVAGAAILALPVLIFAGLPDRSVWDLILISTVVQVAYVLTLAAAYRVGDLSFVYPLARGTSPVLVSLAGVAFLGDEISALGWIGVLTVTVALTWLAWRRADRSGLALALVTGLLISLYTSIDAAAVREQGSAAVGHRRRVRVAFDCPWNGGPGGAWAGLDAGHGERRLAQGSSTEVSPPAPPTCWSWSPP